MGWADPAPQRQAAYLTVVAREPAVCIDIALAVLDLAADAGFDVADLGPQWLRGDGASRIPMKT